ncbi:MAG: hypothetical protein KDM64_06275 [Verrucomicrobiae bacterium]|nr:hypothetical protein [Verrucomicrobiae bacterium]
MSKTIDVEPAEGNATSPQSGGKWLPMILGLLLAVSVIGAGVLGWLWSEEQKKVLSAEASVKDLTQKVGDLERERDGLTGQLNDSKQELERERADRLKEREQLMAERRDELQRVYGQFNEIVYDSRKTLEYIGTVEEKLKAGKALSEKEASELRSVATGLEFLKQQYSKPIQEFRELERYLAEQLAAPAMVAPKERYGLLKRIFSDDYKREREEFFKEQGQREAFDRARTKVQQAYSNAQAQIKSISLDADKMLDQIDALAKSNETSAAGIQEFFDKSKEILKIHDKIMNIEPEKELQGVRP